ncbi:MAG: hypothetical protein ACI9BW_000532 [Gammaproteobacteria bacterium]|jgi:hypothetical protein
MNKLQFSLFACAVLLVTACSKQEPTQSANTAPPTEESSVGSQTTNVSPVGESDAESAAAIAEQSTSTSSEGTPRYVDHTKDKVEFALKRSLAGAQSLLEDVKDPVQASLIKQQIAELHAKLEAL